MVRGGREGGREWREGGREGGHMMYNIIGFDSKGLTRVCLRAGGGACSPAKNCLSPEYKSLHELASSICRLNRAS